MHVFVCDTHKLKQNLSPPPRKVIRKPDTGMLAGLLGSAIGVMATVSIVELVVKNAMEHDAFLVLAAATAGAMVSRQKKEGI